jgi:hypothetical protein
MKTAKGRENQEMTRDNRAKGKMGDDRSEAGRKCLSVQFLPLTQNLSLLTV